MSRSFTYSALTLRLKSSGESNREAWFLTAEEGVIKATVFGGPKSKLRALVAPFHGGTLWIYHDPVRDSRKVSDFDVQSFRIGIRELWERTMTADAVAETILASHGGGGSWKGAAALAANVLDALDSADAGACSRLGIYFLWHWAEVLGIRPDLSACSSCAGEARRDETLWYSAGKEALLCETCMRSAALAGASAANSPIRAGPGARLWLTRIESLPPSALARVSADTPSLEQARALSKAIIAGALGKTLPTWEGI
ncbi:MAG: recombination protein O N-terminal domain-containing protein [Treponema sp.]|nr:recombination protein O N-terminal domain-containing protein [Treponema sp.]